MGVGVFRIDGDRFAKELNRRIVLTDLMQQQSHQPQCVRVLGMFAQDLPVYFLRLNELPGLVVSQPALKRLQNVCFRSQLDSIGPESSGRCKAGSFMTMRLAILLEMLSLVGCAPRSSDVPLDFVPRGFTKQVGGYVPQRLDLTEQCPASLKRLPDHLADPLFGVLPIGPKSDAYFTLSSIGNLTIMRGCLLIPTATAI